MPARLRIPVTDVRFIPSPPPFFSFLFPPPIPKKIKTKPLSSCLRTDGVGDGDAEHISRRYFNIFVIAGSETRAYLFKLPHNTNTVYSV